MSLLYRVSAANYRVAELVVSSNDVACVLIDRAARTANTVICMTVAQAEKLAEQFLHPKKHY